MTSQQSGIEDGPGIERRSPPCEKEDHMVDTMRPGLM